MISRLRSESSLLDGSLQDSQRQTVSLTARLQVREALLLAASACCIPERQLNAVLSLPIRHLPGHQTSLPQHAPQRPTNNQHTTAIQVAEARQDELQAAYASKEEAAADAAKALRRAAAKLESTMAAPETAKRDIGLVRGCWWGGPGAKGFVLDRFSSFQRQCAS
jgi:hypothetical protein